MQSSAVLSVEEVSHLTAVSSGSPDCLLSEFTVCLFKEEEDMFPRSRRLTPSSPRGEDLLFEEY